MTPEMNKNYNKKKPWFDIIAIKLFCIDCGVELNHKKTAAGLLVEPCEACIDSAVDEALYFNSKGGE